MPYLWSSRATETFASYVRTSASFLKCRCRKNGLPAIAYTWERPPRLKYNWLIQPTISSLELIIRMHSMNLAAQCLFRNHLGRKQWTWTALFSIDSQQWRFQKLTKAREFSRIGRHIACSKRPIATIKTALNMLKNRTACTEKKVHSYCPPSSALLRTSICAGAGIALVLVNRSTFLEVKLTFYLDRQILYLIVYDLALLLRNSFYTAFVGQPLPTVHAVIPERMFSTSYWNVINISVR